MISQRKLRLNLKNRISAMLRQLNLFNSGFKASLLIAGLLFLPECLSQQANISELFSIADELRASDSKKVDEIVILLESKKEQFTEEQQEYFFFLKAYQAGFKGQHQLAIDMLNELVKKVQSNTVKFKSLSVLINILMIRKNYNEVFSYMDMYNSLLQNLTEPESRSHGLGIMAFVFNQIEEFDIGLYYADRQIKESVGGRYACFGWQFKLEALFRTGDIDQFEQQYSSGLAACSEARQPVYASIIRSYRIESLIKTDPENAISKINAAKEEVLNTSYSPLITMYDALLSSAYMHNGQADLAYTVGMRALENIDTQSINPSVIMLYDTLYRLSKVRGEFYKALEYHEIFTLKQKMYNDEKTAGLIAFNLAKANIEVKNQRITLLDKDNELLLLQKNLYEQEVKQNRLIMLLLFFVLIIASFMAYRGMSGRKRFRKIAEYDQLTGISNRYHFNNQAWLALSYCEKNAKPAALFLFDLDHFKSINDLHGHAAGDWALQQVVKTCRNFMRNNDVFGRIGGEEFAVVLPGCQTDKAVLLAEICRDAIATIDTSESGKAFPLSASFGVAGSDTSGYQLKQLLADADNAMYRAKEAGRDNVMAFTAEVKPFSPEA